MKRIFGLLLFFLLTITTFAQSLDMCTVTGRVFLSNGSAAAGKVIRVVKVIKSGALVAGAATTATTESDGDFTLSIPQDSIAYLYAEVVGLNTRGAAGVPLAIPAASSATLTTLVASSGLPSVLPFASAAGVGTVTSFSAGDLSPLFTTSEATVTTTPALTFSLSTQSANRIFAGPTTGSAATPTFRALVAADIPDLSSVYQPLDADLTTYAGITPSANVQSVLGAANYAAIKTLLSLNNVENTALSTWAGTTNITTLGTIGTGVWNGTAIAYSKLNLTGAILNADLAGSIARSKLVALTASRAMVTDGSGNDSASATTATELGYVNGVTSAIQTQLDAKQATLVSGTNLKTINSTSLLGSGDISISASPAGSNGDYQINSSGSFGAGVLAQSAGRLSATPTLQTSGVASYFRLITPADTALTASTESIGAQFGGNTSAATVTRQWATGALATQRENLFVAPTYAFVGASTVTTAVNIEAASPIAGTNATLTNSYAARFVASSAAHVPLVLKSADATGVTYFNTFNTGFSVLSANTGGDLLHTYLNLGYNAGSIATATGVGLITIGAGPYVDNGLTVSGGFHMTAAAWQTSADSSLMNIAPSGVSSYTNNTDFSIVSFKGTGISGNQAGRTTTNAMTLWVNGAPSQGSNETISNLYALRVSGGVASAISGLFEAAASNSAAVLVSKSGSSGTGDLWRGTDNSDAVKAAITSAGRFQIGASGAPVLLSGSGSPESAITAPVGSVYLRTDGGASTSIYIKESGSGSTGWTGK